MTDAETIEALKQTLREAILDTRRVTNYEIVARDTYLLDWSERTRAWAALCGLDIDRYNPWNGKPKE